MDPEFDDMLEAIQTLQYNVRQLGEKISRIERRMREEFDNDDLDFEMTDIDE